MMAMIVHTREMAPITALAFAASRSRSTATPVDRDVGVVDLLSVALVHGCTHRGDSFSVLGHGSIGSVVIGLFTLPFGSLRTAIVLAGVIFGAIIVIIVVIVIAERDRGSRIRVVHRVDADPSDRDQCDDHSDRAADPDPLAVASVGANKSSSSPSDRSTDAALTVVRVASA